VLTDASAGDARLSLREGRLAAQALGPDRRLCRLTAQPTSSDQAMPGTPLLRIRKSGSDLDVGEAAVQKIQ
jgi:hypothetical protein